MISTLVQDLKNVLNRSATIELYATVHAYVWDCMWQLSDSIIRRRLYWNINELLVYTTQGMGSSIV